MDPSSEMEQSKRRSLAPGRRFELRETAEKQSRLYAVIVGSIALIVFLLRWL